ncbi:hypothetical protein TH63_05025 [Rufibacter radiotolerans]|uniref:MobA-like NTP transferase domain-containing protein n=2 Tax=Rufibacter radiotolerans TaxID=1379910 RepID=A0A0H4W3Z8_9BACT|nr:hypothetical protein TH63_05025 [Rufibacter radiotolerans]
MSPRPTLLVLAAGMSSRYGRLKQLEPFGPHGETIMEYSIYDALQAGFGKVVFVIRKAIEKEFRAAMDARLPANVPVAYVRQELDKLPEGFRVPEGRQKPWGTAHALWVATSALQEGPFAVINGDDFYGRKSFDLVARFFRENHTPQEHALVGFHLQNTLSDYGAVSRALCELTPDGYLTKLTELTQILRTETGIQVQDAGAAYSTLTGREMVSMNLMGFKPDVLPYLERCFREFLIHEGYSLKEECVLSTVVGQMITAGQARVKVLPSKEKWFGVTYPEDKPGTVQNLAALVQAGVYPENLWANFQKA